MSTIEALLELPYNRGTTNTHVSGYMQIGFIIYNGMTLLDFVGVYDPLVRLKTMGFLPKLRWEVCARQPEVAEINGLYIKPTLVPDTLSQFDIIIVPGGIAANKLQHDTKFIQWLQTAKEDALKVSVCSGALLLGAAGFLRGKQATTHPASFQALKQYSASVIPDRVVDEGKVITARGVTASIDLGLYLCKRLTNMDIMQQIKRQIDYPYSTENSHHP